MTRAKHNGIGGVATGNIKAQDALMAIKVASATGSNPKLLAMAIKTGMSSAAVAVLLANSVKKPRKSQ